MARKTLDDEKITRIRELRKQGKEYEEIAKQEGISVGVAHKYGQDIELKTKSKNEALTLSEPFKTEVDKYKAKAEIEREKLVITKTKLEQKKLEGYLLLTKADIVKIIQIARSIGFTETIKLFS